MKFTIDELEMKTGYSKEAILDYLQNIIGIRQADGSKNSRYPQLVLDKLLFIKIVQSLAICVRVSEIKAILAATSDYDLKQIVNSEKPFEMDDKSW